MDMKRILHIGCWGCAAGILLLTGCGRGSTAERSYLNARRAELEQQSAAPRPNEIGTEMARASQLVRSSPAESGEGTTEDWVGRQLALCRGDVLFPQWKARRSGLTKYEVTFEYTLVDESTHIQRVGYAWDVDLSLNIVSTSRVMIAEEIETRMRPRQTGKRRMPVTAPAH